MKLIQTIYVISAVIMSVIIVGVSCFQLPETNTAIEIPFESPMDEDAKDISDDFADDKEYISHMAIPSNYARNILHSAGYLTSHANQVKKISTPPPKF